MLRFQIFIFLLIKCISFIHSLPQNPYGASSGSPSFMPPTHSSNNAFGVDQEETFEERTAAWRRYQQEQQQKRTAAEAASPTDETGRMKLLATVSNASICFFFFVLMWRAVHHYECADAAFRGTTRLVMVLPPVLLFVGNMAGCVASFSSPSHSSKKRLKAILNLNKLLEAILFLYNVTRLTITPSKQVTREIYVGRTLSNFIFIVQCQLFTKVAWNAARQMQGIGSDEEYAEYPQRTSREEYQYEEYQQQPYNQNTEQSYDGYQGNQGYQGTNQYVDGSRDGDDERW